MERVRYRGGVAGFLVWLPWPAATLSVDRDEAILRGIVGVTRVGRQEIARVHLRKKLFQWELRFERHDGRRARPVFVPLTSQPVVRDPRRLGWVARRTFRPQVAPARATYRCHSTAPCTSDGRAGESALPGPAVVHDGRA